MLRASLQEGSSSGCRIAWRATPKLIRTTSMMTTKYSMSIICMERREAISTIREHSGSSSRMHYSKQENSTRIFLTSCFQYHSGIKHTYKCRESSYLKEYQIIFQNAIPVLLCIKCSILCFQHRPPLWLQRDDVTIICTISCAQLMGFWIMLVYLQSVIA